MTQETEEKQSSFLLTLFRTSAGLGVASLIFTAAASLMLVMTYAQLKTADPVDNPAIETLVKRYEQNPDDRELAEAIRALDFHSRKSFFLYQQRIQTGRALAGLSLAVCLAGFGCAFYLSRKLPHPEPCAGTGENEFVQARISRKLIAGVSVLAVVLSAVMFFVVGFESAGSAPVPGKEGTVTAGDLEKNEDEREPGDTPAETGEKRPDRSAGDEKKIPEPIRVTDEAELKAAWVGFRGYGCLGIAPDRNPPLEFDLTTGKNVTWKVETPGPGVSSPVVFRNKLFISTATADSRSIVCLSTENGEVLWEHPVDDIEMSPEEPPKVFNDDETLYAAPSMTTDGKRVYAVYANGDLVCCDMDGNRVWGYSLGMPDNHYGHSTSLLMYMDFLIVQFDHAAEAFVTAINGATGDTVWETARDGISWASPVLAEVKGKQILVLNNSIDTRGYDVLTGTQLWLNKTLQDLAEVGTSPAVWEETVYTANESTPVTALNLSNGKTVWQEELPEYNVPTASSPLATGRNLYFFSFTITCVDKTTGKLKYEEDSEDEFYSSAILAGEHIINFDRSGNMYALEDTDTYTLVSMSKLGEKVDATPAFVGNRMYVRSINHIYCFEKKE